MKVKHYVYADPRKENAEIKNWFTENFEVPEAIETGVTPDTITFEAIAGPVVITYVEITAPLIVEGHTFELLVEYHVDYTIGDKVFSSKIVNEPWSQKRIAEVALVHYATSQTRVFKAAKTPKEASKAKSERELLASLKAAAKAKKLKTAE